jgi:hypothetical protein
MILDSIDSLDVSFFVEMHAVLELVASLLGSLVPSRVHVLHEERIAFESANISHLHNSHIASSTNNVADVNEVVALYIC